MQHAVQTWRRHKDSKKNLGKTGVILSWTEIFVAPPRFESQLPYTVVLVEFESGERIYGELVDYDESSRSIGSHVTSVFRRMGDVGPEDVIEYGIKFRPE